MNEWLVPGLLIVLPLMLLLQLWLLLRRADDAALKALGESLRSHERELRAEVQGSASATRQELATALSILQQSLLTQGADAARAQSEQIDAFRLQLAGMQQHAAATLNDASRAQAQHSQASREAQDAALKRVADSLAEQLRVLSEANERRLGEVRMAVENKLAALQDGNEKKLEQMRATVDEKLHATLEHRLGESFKQVADRL
jgi:DNA recombination protein RmuC